MTGRIHSFQSLGTLDGPGVRFVVFLQGCHLRCGCCHNPDTWSVSGGTEYTVEEILGRVVRCRAYFGDRGGITVSGGEPLLQAEFVHELFKRCHDEGIHTCLDTSGTILTDAVKNLLAETDLVLLDVKYTSEALYQAHVGGKLADVMAFLAYLNANSIPTVLRQVTIPGLNDAEEDVRALKAIAIAHPCVAKTELLPFRKICQTKYDSLAIPFPFSEYPTPDKETMQRLQAILAE